MFAPIPDLSQARILISNDDGINAPGIQVLERVARTLSNDVWVVAPESEQSAVAHSLTIRRPLRVHKVSERRFCVDGTPTDSVLLGIHHVLQGKKPDLVLSGINRGANLGDDVTYSGTVAAAMEATILGVPAIALSQYFGPEQILHWDTAEHWAPLIIRRLAAAGWAHTVLMNVNFPALPADQVSGIQVARQGKRKLGDEFCERLDPRGDPYFWIGAQRAEDVSVPGTDIHAVVQGGAISVTPLGVDLTDFDSLSKVSAALQL